ncbi:hypothetical protein BDV25DRAFT_98125 [Aspergillus avenaceus]|uniref:Uncharacterized protein n=1 Tax=Aspergillus avenaceus TaxID=36643 RepID=A0A5N6TD91_ASPAV|nr:hypothetical protein BDV25DRAFT_98125 [Aspergillus avenaceus]
MGSLLSIQGRDKQRRSNRLSKPPLTFNSPSTSSRRHTAGSKSPVSPDVTIGQDPLTATSATVSSSGLESSGQTSNPSLSSPRPEAPRTTYNEINKRQSIAGEPTERCLRSISSSSDTSRSLCRRSSVQSSQQTAFQPTALRSDRQSLAVHSGQPRRSYSVHAPPYSTSASYQTRLEEATSSNTHFMVESPGFSLIRRRSLLTRPGIATRRSVKNAVRRCPSPIGQETAPSINDTDDVSHSSQLPVTWAGISSKNHNPRAQCRPATPSDFEYTHLGALKLGSLRVVNGSASPCPSDRSRPNPNSLTPDISAAHTAGTWHSNNHEVQLDSCNMPVQSSTNDVSIDNTSIPGTILGSHYNKQEPAKDDLASSYGSFGIRPSTLQIPSPSDAQKYEDLPTSAFSFEGSPTIPVSHQSCAKGNENGSIIISDNDEPFGFSTKNNEDIIPSRKLSRVHRMVDSGYSSAASVRSLQDTHSRVSKDSRDSAQRPSHRRFTFDADTMNRTIYDASAAPGYNSQPLINRHLSLQNSRASYRGHSNSWSTGRSTMCHEISRSWTNGCPRSSSFSARWMASYTAPSHQYCARLRSLERDSFGSSINPVNSSNPAAIQLFQKTVTGMQISGTHMSHDTEMGRREDAIRPKTVGMTGRNITRLLDSDHYQGAETCRTDSAGIPVKSTPTMQHGQVSQVMRSCTAAEHLDPQIQALLIPTPHSQGTAVNVRFECVERPRGRARSRTIELEKRKLAKQRKGSDILMATSPCGSR